MCKLHYYPKAVQVLVQIWNQFFEIRQSKNWLSSRKHFLGEESFTSAAWGVISSNDQLKLAIVACSDLLAGE